MNAPAPAAVRAAMKLAIHITQEEAAAYTLDKRLDGQLLTDHIRAVAEEMRNAANILDTVKDGNGEVVFRWQAGEHALHLRKLADKLEGKEP